MTDYRFDTEYYPEQSFEYAVIERKCEVKRTNIDRRKQAHRTQCEAIYVHFN